MPRLSSRPSEIICCKQIKMPNISQVAQTESLVVQRCQRRGFVLMTMCILLLIVVILGFAYNRLIRSESQRIHWHYWNEKLTKAAEGAGEAAFSWFLSHPAPEENQLIKFLTSNNVITEKDGNSESELDLTSYIPFKLQFGNDITIEECKIAATRIHNFFAPDGRDTECLKMPSSKDFSAKKNGYIFPYPIERYGLLKVSIAVSGKNGLFKRKYEVIREFKIVNILPEIFGQFTLFVKENNSENKDWNQLKSQTIKGEGFYNNGFADSSSPFSNPMMLIHHPDDYNRTAEISSLKSSDVSPDWNSKVELSKRGWVFIGANWIWQPFAGSISNPEAKNFDSSEAFIGSDFILSNHQMMAYHTAMNELRKREPRIPPYPFSWTPDPFVCGGTDLLADYESNSHPKDTRYIFQGVMFILQRFGFYSLSPKLWKTIMTPRIKSVYGWGLREGKETHPLQNFYSADQNQNLSFDGSLVYPMGDLFVSNGTINDRRSPTVVLGPLLLRFEQHTCYFQIYGSVRRAIEKGLKSFWDVYLNDVVAKKPVPNFQYLPFFPITDATKQYSFYKNPNEEIKFEKSGGMDSWDQIEEKYCYNRDQCLEREYAAIEWKLVKDILGTKDYVAEFMSKSIEAYPMAAFDQIVQNNMRNETHVKNWFPDSHSLKSLPETMRIVSDDGTEKAMSGDEKDVEKVFFSSDGESRGESLILQNTNKRPLMIGNLSAIWPFSKKPLTGWSQFSSPSDNSFDLRRKTTHYVKNTEFANLFIKKKNNDWFLDLQGKIITVYGGNLTIGEQLETLRYDDGGVVILSEGNLKISSNIIRTENTKSAPTLTFSTASTNGDIILKGGKEYDAFFISSGTLRKTGGVGLYIKGGLAVRYLDFSTTENSIFKGPISRKEDRFTIVWDPSFGVYDENTHRRGLRIHIGNKRNFWKSEPYQ